MLVSCSVGRENLADGEQEFRRTLIDGLDVLSRSTGIKDPAAWLYWYISREVPHV